MPIKVADIEAFFDRHPEIKEERETVIKMAKSSSSPDGSISSGVVEWILPGTELVEKFFTELHNLKT